MAKLPKDQFFTALRLVKRSDINVVTHLRTATFQNLNRLGLERDESKAVGNTPKGSDQVDTGSLVTWMRGIKPDERKACEQLVTLDATLVARS